MNRIKAKKTRGLTAAEMLDQEKQLEEELFNLRLQLVTGQLENIVCIREVCKSIVHIKAVLCEQVK